jgi:hypothetical protein
LKLAVSLHLQAEGPSRGNAPLFHRNRSQTAETDDVADGEDVWLSGPEIGVDLHTASVVGLDTAAARSSFSTSPWRPTA